MRDKDIERLRKLRRRAEALNETITDDLRRFLHRVDGKTFRRLPWSLSMADDVSVASTCTALMTLAAANELESFYKSPKPSIEKSLAAVKTVALDSLQRLKDDISEGNKSVVMNAIGRLVNASKTVAAGARLASAVGQGDSDHVLVQAAQTIVGALLEMLLKVEEPIRQSIDFEFLIEARTAVTSVAAAATELAQALNRDDRQCSNQIPIEPPNDSTSKPTLDEITASVGIALTNATSEARAAIASLVNLANIPSAPMSQEEETLSPIGFASEKPDLTEEKWSSIVRSVFAALARASWTSSMLPEGNAFTVTVVLRTAGLLSDAASETIHDADRR